MMTPGIGIVGLGAVADLHALAIRAIDGNPLVACCSREEAKAAAFAQKYGCTSYTSMKGFLAHPGLEIVSITTASGCHLEPALQAIAAGKHVMIEKPLEITLERCDRILNEAERKGVLVAGIFQSRFQPVAGVLKSALHRGRFGRLVLGDACVKWFRNQAYYDKTPGRGTWAYDGGGALMNQGIHAIDLLQWYMGPVEGVQAYTATVGHERVEVEDNAVAAVHFKNGAFGVIQGSTSVYPGYPKRIEISGTKGSAVLEESVLKAWDFAETQPEDSNIRATYGSTAPIGGGASDPMAINFAGHQREFEDLIRAVESGEKPALDGREARKAVAIILAIYRSAEMRREILVTEQ